ncbi:hypothetical protein [Sinorhizobium sp. BJ1]|uniref:hypothetical protein n=1 Tax=Sinorhizobium sp. BJ1 TaxID=2035455 RepID=UPI000BEA90BC|nr:hypothetical protein [Sinorhizobium sp. BJ1]PDT86529.1 hypothetical protein CO676_02240 [Sinorhizobium sp. BJ1]
MTPKQETAQMSELTRPIIGIQNRTAQEVFDIMSDRIRSCLLDKPEAGEAVAWVIPGDDNARDDGWLDAMAWREGEFTRPLYAHPSSHSPLSAGDAGEIERLRKALQGLFRAGQKQGWDHHYEYEMEAARAALTQEPTHE